MDVLAAIRTRRSIRSYSSTAIPEEVLERVRQALRFAPSACNFQPWHFIFVTSPELRRRLAAAACDQMWMAEAPCIVVGCALPAGAYKGMGGYGNSAEIDVSIAFDHLTLAAVADGLGTCWIGAFDESQVKQLLGIPAEAKPVVITPLGYPASSDMLRPLDENDRKPPADIFSTDRY